jgi:hypothetical protein
MEGRPDGLGNLTQSRQDAKRSRGKEAKKGRKEEEEEEEEGKRDIFAPFSLSFFSLRFCGFA